MSIVVKDLTKIFGEQKAVDNINFSIEKGEIAGFLGPNGAGKSTTMKIGTGFIPPSSGTISIDGLDVQQNLEEVKRIVGYLPENNPLYIDMYVREYLEFVGKIHGLKGSSLNTRIKELIDITGLEREKHKKIEELSKGYRQRIGLAQALMHDPSVLFLDEPTSGLDPNQIVEIRSLISELGKEKTVVLSSHIMQEVEAICNRAVIINLGKIVADDSVENLKSHISGNKEFVIEFDSEINIKVLQNLEGVNKVLQEKGARYQLSCESKIDPRPKIFDAAKENNWTILEIRTLETRLENIFQKLTKD